MSSKIVVMWRVTCGVFRVHGTSIHCFVLETIRTSAMRVIHITVETKETQKLRVVFVLHCSTSQTQAKTTIQSVNRSTNLATGRHLHPWMKDMRTALQKVSNVCLAVANPSKDEERSPTSHLSVHGCCILDHSLLQGLSCSRQPATKTKQNPTAHLPCKDHVQLDQPISINAHIVVNAPEPATTLQHLNNLDACSPYQTPDATRCVRVHFDAEFYPS